MPYLVLLPWIALLLGFKVQSDNIEQKQIFKSGEIHQGAEPSAPAISSASSNIQGCIFFFSEFKEEINLVRSQGMTRPSYDKLEDSQTVLTCWEPTTAALLPMCVMTCLHHAHWAVLRWLWLMQMLNWLVLCFQRWQRKRASFLQYISCEVAKVVCSIMPPGKGFWRLSMTLYVNDGLSEHWTMNCKNKHTHACKTMPCTSRLQKDREHLMIKRENFWD